MTLDRLEETEARLNEVLPYVDRIVVIDGGSIDGTREMLGEFVNKYGETISITIVDNPWPDVFSEQRNKYLEQVPDYSWCLISDPDEHFPVRTLLKLRLWVQMSDEAQVFDMFEFQAVDIFTDYKNDIIAENRAQWWKGLFFFKYPSTHYTGNPHETLNNAGTKSRTVRETYEHIKKHGVIWIRGHRNFFVQGGGPNLGENQPLWKPFRELVDRTVGIFSWPEMDRYYQKGNINQEIKDWFVEHRDHPKDQPEYDGASEVREGYYSYFVWYHPEELTQAMVNSDTSGFDYDLEITLIHGPDKWKELGFTKAV